MNLSWKSSYLRYFLESVVLNQASKTNVYGLFSNEKKQTVGKLLTISCSLDARCSIQLKYEFRLQKLDPRMEKSSVLCF